MAEPDTSNTDGPAPPRRADSPGNPSPPPLAVVPGTGQLTRCGAVIAFAAAPFPPLADTVATGPTDLGNRLAALVARSDPAPPPFVVLDLTTPACYRYGALHLDPVLVAPADDGPGGDLASDIITVRRPGPDESAHLVGPVPIEPATGIRCQIDVATAPAPGTDLQGGTIPAGGFVLAPDPLADPADQGDDRAEEPAGGTTGETAGDTADSIPAVVAVDAPPLVQPFWDPLADPEGIDLATLGTTRRRALPVPTPAGPSPTDQPPSELTPSAPTPSARRPPPVPPPPPAPPADDRSGATLIDPTDQGDATILPTEAIATAGPPARVRLDDGRVVAVGAGAHIGRAPDPSQLPAGFQPVTVAGDEVSRVHWELVTGPDDALAVRNLSRTTVTRLRPPGWYGTTIASDDSPTAILPGTTVHFGSRWAVVER